MPYTITSIDPQYLDHVKVKHTETKASLEFSDPNFGGLEQDFVLLIGLEELNRPRMWYDSKRRKRIKFELF